MIKTVFNSIQKYPLVKKDIDNLLILLDETKILLTISWGNGYVTNIRLKETSCLNDSKLYAHEISIKEVSNFFSKKTSNLLLPFSICITPFMKKVYQETLNIPFSKTISYKELADILKTSPRAIGQAMKKNPIPLIIPCHRVIGKNGQLTGFSSGLRIKEKLLNFEKGNINIIIKANLKTGGKGV